MVDVQKKVCFTFKLIGIKNSRGGNITLQLTLNEKSLSGNLKIMHAVWLKIVQDENIRCKLIYGQAKK